MAIELDVKPKDRFLFPATVLLVVSVSIFSVFLASYLFFEVRSRMITNEIKNIEEKLVNTADESALEAKIISFKEKVDTFKNTLAERKDVNRLLAVMESNAHPLVIASKIVWKANDFNLLEVTAETDNLEAFGQQVMIWKKISSLQSITLSALEKGKETGITFTVQLTFDSGVFE